MEDPDRGPVGFGASGDLCFGEVFLGDPVSHSAITGLVKMIRCRHVLDFRKSQLTGVVDNLRKEPEPEQDKRLAGFL